MHSPLPTMPRSITFGPVTVLLAGVVLWIGAAYLSQMHARDDLMNLSEPDRVSLYTRTLETLRNACAHSSGAALSDYCHEQALFLARFPECNSDCQDVCRRFNPRPTK